MTKFYSIALAGALALGGVSATAVPRSAKLAVKHGAKVEAVHPGIAGPKTVRKASAAKGSRHYARLNAVKSAANDVWRPTTQTIFEWDGEAWTEVEQYTTTWNSDGQPLVDITKSLPDGDEWGKIEYTYDEYGYLVSERSFTGSSLDDLEPSSRKTVVYDPVIHNLVVSNTEEMWNPVTSAWMQSGNIFRRTVTRNADGKVTSVVREQPYADRWDPLEKYEFTYGPDGTVTKIVNSVMQFDASYAPTDWLEDLIYENIEWYKFDGQIYDMDCIFEGSNKVKTYTQIYNGKPVVVSNVVYVGDTDDFDLVGDMGYAAFTQSWVNHENGGYTSKTVYTEEAEEGMDPYVETNVDCCLYDVLGNELLVVGYIEADGIVELGYYSKADETIDPTNEYPSDYILREFWPFEDEEDPGYEEYAALSRVDTSEITAPLDALEGEWVDFIKITFSDYAQAGTGAVDKIATDIADGNAEYFTIDGRRVNGTPASGLYIRRTATGAQKVLVR